MIQVLCEVRGIKSTGTIGQLAKRLSDISEKKRQKQGEKRDLTGSKVMKTDTDTKTPKIRKKRAEPTREREKELWEQGFGSVAGVDEAGRGPLAGPVVAAAVILPHGEE